MTSCPGRYKSSVSGAGVAGAFQGAVGLFGLGGFWKPVDDSKLKQAKQDLKDTQDKYDTYIQSSKDELNKDQQEFLKDQSTYMQTLQEFHDELQNEKISTNALFIQITAIVVIIIIIYLVLL